MDKERSYTFTCNETPRKSFEYFEAMRNEKEFCDVTIQVGNESISAHRIIITAAIPYFRDVFSRSDSQRDEQEISLSDIEPSALKCLIQFAYSCQVKIDMENVISLLSAACVLGVDAVREACCDFLGDNLEPENVLNIRQVVESLNCSRLFKRIDRYVKQNFGKISQTKKFLECPFTFLKELIGSDELNVEDEENVYDSVMLWVKASSEYRKKYLPELLTSVRMVQMKPLQLANIVKNEELIRSSVSCRDLVDEAKNYILFPEMREDRCSFSTERRKSVRTAYLNQEEESQCILKLSGQLQFTAQYFDLVEEKWINKEREDISINSSSFAELNNKLYFFNWGFTLQYNLTSNKYEFLQNFPTPRRFAAAASLKGKVYVCGGRAGSGVSNAVECFDPKKNEWKSLSFMHTARWGLNAVALGEHIYILGGRDASFPCNCVERYDTVTDKWEDLSSMHIGRYFAGAAALGDKIYVCGGNGGLRLTNAAEVYNRFENTWDLISPMNTVRYWFTLLPCRGKLYAIGGKDKEGFLNKFDIYDPESDEWTWGPSTDPGHVSSGAVAIPGAHV